MKITFVTRALDFGGAERQLVELAKGFQARGHRVRVVVFYPGGDLEPDLRAAGIPVVSLDKSGRWDLLGFNLRLVRALRAGKPDVVHGYLGGPNILCALLKPAHRARVVWGVRDSGMESETVNWWSRLDGMVERRLAALPDLIIANSQAGKRHAVAKGFPSPKTIVIPNGVDTEKFQFDPAGRARARAEFGIADDAVLIGRVGRIAPQKDYPTFLETARLIADARADARFLIAGRGDPAAVAGLQALATKLGIADKVVWAGARDDMTAVYSAFDLSISSSAFGEGTPNVVAESMACGVPCAVTNAGDSAWTAGGFSPAAPVRDPNALAAAALDLLARRDAIGRAALRESVVSRLSLASLYRRTEAALERTIQPRAAARAQEPNEAAA